MRWQLLALVLAVSAVAVTGCTAITPIAPGAAPAPAQRQPLTAQAVTAGLIQLVPSARAGIEYTAADDPNRLLGRPNGYGSKTSFIDTRVSADAVEFTMPDAIERGGSVEVFDDAAAAAARRDYIHAIGKGFPAAVEYDYVADSVLVRVSRELTPEQAAEYERALGQIVDG